MVNQILTDFTIIPKEGHASNGQPLDDKLIIKKI
jgi:hypothetical protein